VEQRPIRVIAMLAKTQNGSSFWGARIKSHEFLYHTFFVPKLVSV
jgi:hypothetical protein